MNIFITNLSLHTTDEDLLLLFQHFGPVTSAKVVIDKETGSCRGFGFVEMNSCDDAQRAIHALDGRDIEGRSMLVADARNRTINPDTESSWIHNL